MKARKDSGRRHIQYAALPFRIGGDNTVEVMLVTSRGTGRWVIPKGWPMKDRKPHAAARQEAFEEAGIRGSISKTPIGAYVYEKRMDSRKAITCEVMVFPLEVSELLESWPEMGQREKRWFTPGAAAEAVREPELRDLIRWLPSMIDVPAPIALSA